MHLVHYWQLQRTRGTSALATPARSMRTTQILLVSLLISLPFQAAIAAFPQTVFLDFDTFTGDDVDDFVYAPPERMIITDVLNDKFVDFPVTFTDVEPTTGLWSIVYYNAGLGSVGDIDFQNKSNFSSSKYVVIQ